jgi:hypothetical protein
MGLSRPASLHIGRRELQLPVYFPSISSVKTALRPYGYLQFLSSLVGLNGQFLVSAYDLAEMEEPEMAMQALKIARGAGAVTLMDSGNYESFWKDAQNEWKQGSFHGVLKEFPCDIAFGFDEQQPPADTDEHVALVVSRWQEDQRVAEDCVIVPIIHGSADELPILCARVANNTGVSMVAVPERRLGDGVIDRARTVDAIRRELNKLGRYIALHLLGTGNPISIALYAANGADSFDGLEWCQTVVDHDTALLFHLSQSDFFEGQTGWADAGLSSLTRGCEMGGGGGGSLFGSDIKNLEAKVKERLAEAKAGVSRHVFISFAYEDVDEVNLLRGQAKNDKTDLQFDDFSVKEAFDSVNADYIKRQIRERIDRCSVTVVYLSAQSASSKWVNWEVEESLKRGKGVIGVYKGDSPPTKLPASFQQNECKAVRWEHAALMKAIEDVNAKR